MFARELVSRGAAKVYGAARSPAAVTEPGVTPVALDITDPGRVARVAQECADVTLLVNNAGVMKAGPESVAQQTFDAVEAGEIEVLADERSRSIKAMLSSDRDLIYAPLQQQFFGSATTNSPADG